MCTLFTVCTSHVLQEIDLAELYMGLLPGAAVYGLRSAVCHYGQQRLCAFVRRPRSGAWLALDDGSTGRILGSWPEAREKCAAGSIQPAVLLFEARFPASSPAGR